MMMKLLMTWDIRPGKESAYFDFVSKELVPGLMRLGIQPTEAWYTIYGDAPQILAGWVADDLATMQAALASEEWRRLRRRLMKYVINFKHKIVPATGFFQL
ncbi:MAG TPA: hypothetical protein EYP55_07575 [Anaerolineae bacterium]|nr:hypothetical protein [Anaerolineae bacterium]